ncbi:hypothetical protein C8Q70DRAFT_1094289 [Cubamyces menziesii]|nr:hypothetical protein C8Q70DRAFT_1094289 [Cubamyces menziesii]
MSTPFCLAHMLFLSVIARAIAAAAQSSSTGLPPCIGICSPLSALPECTIMTSGQSQCTCTDSAFVGATGSCNTLSCRTDGSDTIGNHYLLWACVAPLLPTRIAGIQHIHCITRAERIHHQSRAPPNGTTTPEARTTSNLPTPTSSDTLAETVNTKGYLTQGKSCFQIAWSSNGRPTSSTTAPSTAVAEATSTVMKRLEATATPHLQSTVYALAASLGGCQERGHQASVSGAIQVAEGPQVSTSEVFQPGSSDSTAPTYTLGEPSPPWTRNAPLAHCQWDEDPSCSLADLASDGEAPPPYEPR